MDRVLFILMVVLLLPSTIKNTNMVRYLLRTEKDSKGHLLSTLVLDQPLKRSVKGPWEIEMEHNKLDSTEGNVIQTIAKMLVRARKGGGSSTPEPEVTTSDEDKHGDHDGVTYSEEVTYHDSNEFAFSDADETSGEDTEASTEADSGSYSGAPPVSVSIVPEEVFRYFPEIGCFKLYKEATTYAKANKICGKSDSHLNIINSKAEQKVLDAVIGEEEDVSLATCAGYYFIAGKKFFDGGGQKIERGRYYNAFNKEIDTLLVPWGPRQPNDPITENCVAYIKNNGLHDVPCSWNLSFICQKEFC